MKKKKKTKKKQKHIFSIHEFLFDFVSLVLVIGVAIYFGYRSLYYYSKQNIKKEQDLQTLNGIVVQNIPVVNSGDGLYKDTNGYFFRGKVDNNYVLLGNSLFRIIRIYNDQTVRLVSEDYVASFPWGENSSYQESNVHLWLEKGEDVHSGIYYSMIPEITNYFQKTSYTEDVLEDTQVVSGKDEYSDYVSLLSIRDYINANGKNGFLNTGKLFYLLGYSSNQENLYVEEDGSVQYCDSLSGFGIRPVLTLKANTTISVGDGTINNPYRLEFDNASNMYSRYVKLGNDIWRIYAQEGDILRLHLNGFIQENGVPVALPYSNTNSVFSITDKKNIGYYLNTNYLNQLNYGTILVDCPSYIGEISDDQGYNFLNMYKNVVSSKVTLLNIFDPIVAPELANYFYLNTTSLVGSMEYDRFASGLLEESDVREAKPIVPVVCLSKSSIKTGEGSILDPYVVG